MDGPYLQACLICTDSNIFSTYKFHRNWINTPMIDYFKPGTFVFLKIRVP